MTNIRVHKLATEIGISSKELIDELKKLDVPVKNHMSSIDAETVKIVKDLLKQEEETPSEAILPKREEVQEVVESTVEKEKNVEEEPKKDKIKLPESISVKELAEKLESKTGDVIKTLISMGVMVSINKIIDAEIAVKVAEKFNIEVEVVSVDSDDIFLDEEEEKEENMVLRTPVVTIMGHVDHGKTSLLDAIRESNVTDKEAGGITQHIGAYKVKIEKGDITFLDTPGHEAFTAMRARGAQVTDIIVLVVAADDGVMPQTVEAISHAKAANVPMIVAINKIDTPGSQPDVIKQKLTEYSLVPEEWGGDTIFVEVSAKEKIGLENLLEMILLQTEIMELKSDPSVSCRGIVVESKLDKGRGPVGTIIVQKGTLRVGQPFVVGHHYGKVRALIDDSGKKVKEAGPSTPVEILGFSDVPDAGATFVVVKDERTARQIGMLRIGKQRIKELSAVTRVTLDDLYSQITKGEVKGLNVIIKADVNGSVQALSESLIKLSTAEVMVKIIHGAAGGITDSDIMLAAASNAIIIGFNVRPAEKTVELAKQEKVDVRLYTIIYQAISDIRSAMEGLLDPIMEENVLGRAEVREVFTIPKIGVIAGCYIVSGKIKRNSETRLIRDNVVVYQGKISSLRRFKDDASEVATGFECGIGIERFQDIKQGDIIEPFEYEEIERKL